MLKCSKLLVCLIVHENNLIVYTCTAL